MTIHQWKEFTSDRKRSTRRIDSKLHNDEFICTRCGVVSWRKIIRIEFKENGHIRSMIKDLSEDCDLEIIKKIQES